MQTCFKESELRKQICIKLTFILFKEVLKSTELLLDTSLSSRSISKRLILAVQKFSLSDYHKLISSLCFAVGFWEVQSIKSQNLQNTDCVLNEYFQSCFGSVTGHNRFENQFIHGPRQDCVTCDHQQEPISVREFENIVIETDDWHPLKTHLAVGKNSLKGVC